MPLRNIFYILIFIAHHNFWALCLLCAPVAATASIVLDSHTDHYDLNRGVTIFHDKTGSLKISDILDGALTNKFTPLQDSLSNNYASGTYWLAFTLQSSSDGASEWWLEVIPSELDRIDFYTVNVSDNAVVSMQADGDTLPYSNKAIGHRNSVFRVTLSNNQPRVFFLRITNSTSKTAHLILWEKEAFATSAEHESWFLGAYYGIIAGIFLFTLTQWALYRTRVMIWWSIYLVANAMTIFAQNGLASQFLFPNTPKVTDLATELFIALQVFSGCNFVFEVFERKNRSSWRILALSIIQLSAVSGGFFALLGKEHLSLLRFSLLLLQSAGVMLTTLALILAYLMRGNRVNGGCWYFFGFMLLAVGIAAVFARNTGLLPSSLPIDYLWQTTILFHLFFLHIGTTYHSRSIIKRSKELARRRASNARAATASLKLREELMELVLHEVRNPLSVIGVSVSNLISMGAESDPAMVERYRRIERAKYRIKRLLDNYASAERMTMAYFKPIREKVNLIELLHEVIAEMQLLTSTHDIVFSACPGHIISKPFGRYEDSCLTTLNIDRELIRLALNNVLDNAIKYSPNGRKIVVVVACHEQYINIKVMDHGIGIPASALPHVFDRYYRAPGVRACGSGLGLHLVKTIIDRHGGNVLIESVVKKGTIVSIRLPRRTESAPTVAVGNQAKIFSESESICHQEIRI